MSADNKIEMEGVGKSFFATRALSEVDFSCVSGEVHALVGLNGAGKSTLMKILGGVQPLDEGKIYYNGQLAEITKPNDANELGISMIHQEYSLINELTVAGNIYLGRELKQAKMPFLNKREMNQRVKARLDHFGLKLNMKKPVRMLNSGEKQIVEIIRALISDSWLIVMDEPTSALSEENKERLFDFINQMKSEGISIIYISHHMPEIFDIADRVTVMRDGQVVLTSTTDETTEENVIREMIGWELDHFIKPSKESLEKVILSLRNIDKSGQFSNVSLDVHAGEIVVLTGLRGCGAPELAKAIFGLEDAYQGEIHYRGKKLEPSCDPAIAIQNGMGLVTENRDKNGILAGLSVRDNIVLPFLEKTLSNGLIDKGQIHAKVAGAISQTSVKTSSPNQEIRFLSGGNKQKICFSRWLDPDLQLLILLEPTRGIDVHAKADIYRIIEELAERGVAVLILSYEIDEVIMLADRAITMYLGKTIAEYKATDGFDKEQMLADMAGASGKLAG